MKAAQRRRHRSPPRLLIPVPPIGADEPLARPRPTPPRASAERFAPERAASVPPPPAPEYPAPRPVAAADGAPQGTAARVERAVVTERVVEGAPDETVQFHRPTDEPLQLLPGRLEVEEGENPGEDIRFVRALGTPPRITFGREAGPPHQHIMLRSPTVSRVHARMDYAHGHWSITNLSQTNPVVVNDEELAPAGRTRALTDGDRIEMGEVVFRFRTH